MADLDRILIVGGEIAGLTLASALGRQGPTTELIERNVSWPAIGAGIAVQPNGMRILHALGMGVAVEQAGAPIQRWAFCDQQGELLCETDLPQLWGGVAPFIGIERTKLHRVLVKCAAAIPGRLGTSLVSLDQDGRRVIVGFGDGTSGEYDLVVGADGISSTVRALALSTVAPADLGAVNWRSIAPVRPCGLMDLRLLLGDECFFGLCPVGEGRTYGFGYVVQPRLHDPQEGRLQRLRDRFAEFGELVQGYLAALERDEQVHCSTME